MASFSDTTVAALVTDGVATVCLVAEVLAVVPAATVGALAAAGLVTADFGAVVVFSAIGFVAAEVVAADFVAVAAVLVAAGLDSAIDVVLAAGASVADAAVEVAAAGFVAAVVLLEAGAAGVLTLVAAVVTVLAAVVFDAVGAVTVAGFVAVAAAVAVLVAVVFGAVDAVAVAVAGFVAAAVAVVAVLVAVVFGAVAAVAVVAAGFVAAAAEAVAVLVAVVFRAAVAVAVVTAGFAAVEAAVVELLAAVPTVLVADGLVADAVVAATVAGFTSVSLGLLLEGVAASAFFIVVGFSVADFGETFAAWFSELARVVNPTAFEDVVFGTFSALMLEVNVDFVLVAWEGVTVSAVAGTDFELVAGPTLPAAGVSTVVGLASTFLSWVDWPIFLPFLFARAVIVLLLFLEKLLNLVVNGGNRVDRRFKRFSYVCEVH
ncbi:hypothetical protein [Paeniglutamicibacter terrestris]|uniref:Uncharacterized protein n=1 Tax=Paeniglutamicibacter terrestris TaxID=2723403 RepID=A0ABX1G964_9MICC|nr:hypothetical protein [Paeniglutamicibacter terrestris]NKG22806.1 hypothetical protein [Paeniglutamicibacter terrestris]